MEDKPLTTSDSIRQLAIEMARCAADDKCSDVVILDLQGISSVTDYFLIATGTSDRQLKSVADHLEKISEDNGLVKLGYNGYGSAHWILLDLGSIIIHLFAPSFRELYDLELLWGDAPQVEWQRPGDIEKAKADADEI